MSDEKWPPLVDSPTRQHMEAVTVRTHACTHTYTGCVLCGCPILHVCCIGTVSDIKC